MPEEGKNRVTDNRGIKARLRKLASGETANKAGWRQICSPDDDQPLAAALAEIDETLLPRELGFRNDQGGILRLEAGNRRLRKILAGAPANLSSFSQLFDKALSEPTNDIMDQIGQILRAFLKDSKSLWVRTKRLAEPEGSGPTGISALGLAKAWSIEIGDLSEKELGLAFETFVNALAAESEAWVRTEDNNMVASSDTNTGAEWIENCLSIGWQDFLAGFERPITLSGAPSLCVLGSDDVAGTHLLVAANGASCFFSAVGSAGLGEIVATWRRLKL